MAAQALLADVPHPTRAEIEEGLAGNLCRCACYEQIIEAVEAVADGATARRATPSGAAGRLAAADAGSRRGRRGGLDQ